MAQSKQVEDVKVDDTTCGLQLDYGCCPSQKRKPLRILQCFATPRSVLALFCCLGFTQGFVTNGMLASSLSTIEKRFGLKSAESGLLSSLIDISAVAATPIVMFLGGRGHKPLWIGWGTALMGAGCMLFVVPHFVAPPYAASGHGNDNFLCTRNTTVETRDTSLRNYRYTLYVANVIIGCGSAPLYTLGLTFLDENVAQKLSSLYHGIYFAVTTAIGPALGYFATAAVLTVFTNIGEKVNITNDDAAWIGAWWPGFIACGVCFFALSTPVLLLPRSLPESDEMRKIREQQEVNNKETKQTTSLKQLYDGVAVLLRNPTYILMCFASIADVGVPGALATFSPKYIEVIYSRTPTEGALYTGLGAVVGGTLGFVGGGFIVTKAKLKVVGILKHCCLFTTISLLLTGCMLMHCGDIEFAGATRPYSNASSYLSSTNFTSSCNLKCGCLSDVYQPVCGNNDVTYFSPCFAGCSLTYNQTYFNCSCIGETQSTNMTATPGSCSNSNCSLFIPFICLLLVSMLTTFICFSPNLQVILRVVPFEQRSLAIGLQAITYGGLGVFPITIVIGRLLDLACSVWSTENGVISSCKRYFSQQATLYMFIFIVGLRAMSLICYSLAYVIQRKQPTEKVSAEVNEITDE